MNTSNWVRVDAYRVSLRDGKTIVLRVNDRNEIQYQQVFSDVTCRDRTLLHDHAERTLVSFRGVIYYLVSDEQLSIGWYGHACVDDNRWSTVQIGTDFALRLGGKTLVFDVAKTQVDFK